MTATIPTLSLLDALCLCPDDLFEVVALLHAMPMTLEFPRGDRGDLQVCGSELHRRDTELGWACDESVASLVTADGRHLEDCCPDCLASEAAWWSRKTRVGVRVQIVVTR